MTITLYNTLTNSEQPFTPIDAENVRLYVCGPTVYDYAHVGNARPMVVFDTLARLLRHTYGAGNVTYTRNITDVDDKIIDIARQNGEPIADVTARTTAAFHADLNVLNVQPVDHEPRCTAYIPEMVAMTAELIAKGHAYEAAGHVLFSVSSDPNYGVLSNRDRDEMIAGARVEIAPYKKDAADFVLWKPSSDEQPGWDSPWGRGRPGWHIECSAMAKATLGDVFDIHAGGIDLVFPHHENEIAQSCCANGTDRMANVWLHNGFVTVNGEKMSKSLGNFFTVNQLVNEESYAGETVRLGLLSAQYRQPLDLTREKLKEAKSQLDRLYRAAGDAAPTTPDGRVLDALGQDLNSPLALAALHDLAGKAEPGVLKASANLLGLLEQSADAWFKGDASDDESAEIDALVAARDAARAAKNFAEADRIRDELTARGIVLEDAAGKTGWRRG